MMVGSMALTIITICLKLVCTHFIDSTMHIQAVALRHMSHLAHTLLIAHPNSAMFYKLSQPAESDHRYMFLCYLCINTG